MEVYSAHNLPENKRNLFRKNAVNALLVNKQLFSHIEKGIFLTEIKNAQERFRLNWMREDSYQELINQLAKNIPNCASEEEALFIAKDILFETYRFGKPNT